MAATIVFATSRKDAQDYVEQHTTLLFEEVVWVMNVQLLGDMDLTGADVHYTDTFMAMPAYAEAKAVFA